MLFVQCFRLLLDVVGERGCLCCVFFKMAFRKTLFLHVFFRLLCVKVHDQDQGGPNDH